MHNEACKRRIADVDVLCPPGSTRQLYSSRCSQAQYASRLLDDPEQHKGLQLYAVSSHPSRWSSNYGSALWSKRNRSLRILSFIERRSTRGDVSNRKSSCVSD